MCGEDGLYALSYTPPLFLDHPWFLKSSYTSEPMASAAVRRSPRPYGLSDRLPGLSQEEIDWFNDESNELLNTMEEFVQRVWRVATWASEVDAAFDIVTKIFDQLVNENRTRFLELSDYLTKRKALNKVGKQSPSLSLGNNIGAL